MQERGFGKLGRVSDEQLLGGLKELLVTEGRCEARVVAHLAEVDARRVALKRAQSLFEYCRKELGFSDNQAYYRIAAARVAIRFPIVFELLERREIHLVNIAPLSKLLTDDNHRELLAQAGRLSKRGLLKFLAQRYPRPDVASEIRRLSPRPGAASAGPTGSLEPLSATTYRLQLNTSETLKEKLQLARDLMSHANPDGDLAVVVERALDLLIERLQARRFGQTKRPRQPAPQDAAPPSPVQATAPRRLHRSKPSTSTARPHISNAARRQVVGRDGPQCRYVAEDGCRCAARAFLEFDHSQPWGKGGSSSPKNLRVLCRAHNPHRPLRDSPTLMAADRSGRGGQKLARDGCVNWALIGAGTAAHDLA